MPCDNKIWLENPVDLFCNYSVIPMSGMSFESQMNALTRLVLVIFVVLLLFNYKYAFLFVSVSIVIIIILYYIQKRQMKKSDPENYTGKYIENYTDKYKPPTIAEYRKCSDRCGMVLDKQGVATVNRPTVFRFCNDEVTHRYNDPTYSTYNQKLAGPPNPKTMVAPVVISPSHDLDYWKANNLVNHSAVNRESQQEAYQSGFQVSTCCGNLEDTYFKPEKYGKCASRISLGKTYTRADKIVDLENKKSRTRHEVEEYQYPYPIDLPEKDRGKWQINDMATPGEINTACGYNPEQLAEAGLPSNYPAGNCEKDPVYREYNQNLFTQIIEPGIYTRNQITEPINSNMGISFTQQFEPTSCHVTEEGGVMYTEHDPRIIEPVVLDQSAAAVEPVTEYNVYDPRFSGYGTSYRSYIDNQLGQPRFMYDDIDAIRMPNYLTRNNIDHQPFSDRYGPLPEGGSHGNEYNDKIRALANDSFARGTVQYRTDLQQSLMRKRNAEMWQKRLAPTTGNGQYMLGGMSLR